jgi:hypothetical protein
MVSIHNHSSLALIKGEEVEQTACFFGRNVPCKPRLFRFGGTGHVPAKDKDSTPESLKETTFTTFHQFHFLAL